MPTVNSALAEELYLALTNTTLADSVNLAPANANFWTQGLQYLIDNGLKVQGQTTMRGLVFTPLKSGKASSTGSGSELMQIEVPLAITGAGSNPTSGDAIIANIQAIATKMREAARGSGAGSQALSAWLWVKEVYSSNYVYFSVTGPPEVQWLKPALVSATPLLACVLKLTCLRYPFGDPVLDPVSLLCNDAGPSIYRASIPGDHEAATRLYLLDQSLNSKIATRWTIYGRYLDGLLSTDWTPQYGVTPQLPAAAFSDATAYGFTTSRLVATNSWQNVGSVQSGTGAFNSQEATVMLKARDSSAPCFPPTNFTATLGPANSGNFGTSIIQVAVVPKDAAGNYGPMSGLAQVSLTLLSQGGGAPVPITYAWQDTFENGPSSIFAGWSPGQTNNYTNGAGSPTFTAALNGTAAFDGSYGLDLKTTLASAGYAATKVVQRAPALTTNKTWSWRHRFKVASLAAWPNSATTQTLSGTGTWTPPVGVTQLSLAEVWGGGGGGGSGFGSGGGGGGGGGGAYQSASNVPVAAGTIYTATVGGGGNGGTSNGAGSSGAASNLGTGSTAILQAGGGIGGNGSSNLNGAAGGGAGSGSFSGGTGGSGGTTTSGAGDGGGGGGGGGAGSSGAGGAGGSGGNSSGGTAGTSGAAGSAGSGGGGAGGAGGTGNGTTAPGAGSVPGGGGGGASAATVGGAGAAGQIKLTYTPGAPLATGVHLTAGNNHYYFGLGHQDATNWGAYYSLQAGDQSNTIYTAANLAGPTSTLSGGWHLVEVTADVSGGGAVALKLTVDGIEFGGVDIPELGATFAIADFFLQAAAYSASGAVTEELYFDDPSLTDAYLGSGTAGIGYSLVLNGVPGRNAVDHDLFWQTNSGSIVFKLPGIGGNPFPYTLSSQLPAGVLLVSSFPTAAPPIQPTLLRVGSGLSLAEAQTNAASAPAVATQVGNSEWEYVNARQKMLPNISIPEGQLAPPWYTAIQAMNPSNLANLFGNPVAAANVNGAVGVTNTTVTRITTQALTGYNTAFAALATANGIMFVGFLQQDNTTRIAATAGTTYGFVVWINQQFSGTCQLLINWYNGSGTFLSQSVGSLETSAFGQYVEYQMSATAPATTASAEFYINTGSAAMGAGILFDNVQIYANPALIDVDEQIPLPKDTDSLTVQCPVTLSRPAMLQLDTRRDSRASAIWYDTGTMTTSGDLVTDATRIANTRTDVTAAPGGYGFYSVGYSLPVGSVGTAPRVQAPSGYFGTGTTGGFAAGVLLRSTSPFVGGHYQTIFCWSNATSNEVIQCYYLSGAVVLARFHSASGPSVSVSFTPVVGTFFEVCAYWTATAIGLSINGSAFTSVANTAIPTGLGATIDAGTLTSIATGYELEGDVQWLVGLAGTPTGADASGLYITIPTVGLPAGLTPGVCPTLDQFSATANAQLIWDARTSRYWTSTALSSGQVSGQFRVGPANAIIAAYPEYLDANGNYVADTQNAQWTMRGQFRPSFEWLRGAL